ncbi:MAG: penicillin-binding protein 2 [Elusimicrobium sp.]|jgi:penicillin-binding protein 2|nr:penicillin-binding protein 2 [Elusimicrobium sp.]
MEKKIFPQRLYGLWLLSLVASAVIALRLADIQVIRHNYYKEQSERNRTQTIFQAAPRGRIITAEGTAVAQSAPSFNLYFFPGKNNSQEDYIQTLAREISAVIKEPQEDILAKLKRAVKSGKASVIEENLASSYVLPLAELQVHYNGIYLMEESKRTYPYDTFASHLIGYLGSMEGRAWRDRDQSLDYRLDSKIGRFGIEKKFEKYLKGTDGGLYLEVDHRSRLKSIIEDKKWQPGADIYLTLNFKLQRAAEEGLKNSVTGRGAAVALNPKTGAVLALATAPGFDPNIFVPYGHEETEKDRKEIKEFNLAVQGVYPPASTFKIITAMAANEAGKLDTERYVFCNGLYDAGSRVFKCWSKHGNVNFWSAMAGSCDVYFYGLSNYIGPAVIEKMQRQFMFGLPTGIDIAGERSGNLFGPTRRAKNKTYWFIGDTLNLSIGQGELLATPVKMAQFAAALANRGKVLRPYYIDKIVSSSGAVLFKGEQEVLNEVKVKPQTWDIIFKALKGVVDNGTGRAAKISGLDVYAKTGTAQNPHGRDHAWMIAFAGRNGQEPDIAVAVFVENGLSGAGVAGPIVRAMLRAFYNIEDEKAAQKETGVDEGTSRLRGARGGAAVSAETQLALKLAREALAAEKEHAGE